MSKIQADLIVNNAKQLVTMRGHSQKPAIGHEMERLGILEHASIAINNDQIVFVGSADEVKERYSPNLMIDATNKAVTPGLVDPHTHFVFAGSREHELELKIKGAKYLEILRQGGGILRTVRDTRATPKSELLRICTERAHRLLCNGTTTIEAKSGYGLNLKDEIKILEVISELNRAGPLALVPTFLGAHAIAPEFANKVSEQVRAMCDEWIPKIAERKLAMFCDVFCEKGVFEIQDSREILEAGIRGGLRPKIHADELYPLGGAELAAEMGAISADHLLYASATGLSEMRRANVIATVLPAAPLTLMIDKYADARGIITEGVPLAIGSDLCPSCWVDNQQMIIALACYKLRLTPAEALTASTINAAHAIGKGGEIGSIEVGKKADLIVLDAPDYRFLGYRFGSNQVNTVVKNGKLVAREGRLVA